MIEILDKTQCCGCGACVQICPKQCVSLHEDGEGFLYPVVDKDICVDCGLCEKICPVYHQNAPRMPLAVYSAIHKDEKVRSLSSSGGVFTAMAEDVIKKGGVVFGARFDEHWEVRHSFVETVAELDVFRGSKYVQSRLENSYRKVESFLKQGRKVMFTGTPCQVAGLKSFLRKEYKNLLVVDCVCHGVPGPKVWRKYLDEEIAFQGGGKNSVLSYPIDRRKFIRSIEFRSKSTGWKKYSFALTLSEANAVGEKNTVLLSSMHPKNTFMRAFLSNLILRPSCYCCRFREGRSRADITIGDFWGISFCSPEMDDDKGTSLVMIYTDKGRSFYPYEQMVIKKETLQQAVRYNPCLNVSCLPHPNRELFFELLDTDVSLERLIGIMLKPSFFVRIKRIIKSSIRKIIK